MNPSRGDSGSHHPDAGDAQPWGRGSLPPPSSAAIIARCCFGYPAAVETAPSGAPGMPNTTPLYLACPSLAAVISRAEDEGGVQRLQTSCRDEEWLRCLLARVVRLYKQRCDKRADIETQAPVVAFGAGAGVGGPERAEAVCCLHAYAATLLAVWSGWLDGGEDKALACEATSAWLRFLPPVEDCWCRDERCRRHDFGSDRLAVCVESPVIRAQRPRRMRRYRQGLRFHHREE
ncbi:MAG: DUF501 domain-containing protein [Thermoleophilia bacterium]|nr:DUF501 domain-containing protein [Thermoleophilia bacterium]